jgi:hypothetical protein
VVRSVLDLRFLLKRSQAHPSRPMIVGRCMVSPIFAHNVPKETRNVIDLHIPIPIPARIDENVGRPSAQHHQGDTVKYGMHSSLVSSYMSHLSHFNAQLTPSGMIPNSVQNGVENVHTRGTTSTIPCSMCTDEDVGYSVIVRRRLDASL